MSKTRKRNTAEFKGGGTSEKIRSGANADSERPEAPESVLPGIHVIGVEDSAKHFGPSVAETGKVRKARVGPATDVAGGAEARRKTAVRANIDPEIWLRATKLAAEQGSTMDDYVEKAIDRLNDSLSRTK